MIDTRTCTNAIRSAYNIIPTNIVLISSSNNGKDIIFIADGITYEFHSNLKPSRYSKNQWKQMKTWTIKKL